MRMLMLMLNHLPVLLLLRCQSHLPQSLLLPELVAFAVVEVATCRAGFDD